MQSEPKKLGWVKEEKMILQGDSQKFLEPNQVIKKFGLEEGDSFADLGCGPGFFVIPVARLVGESGKVFAVDVFPNALEEVKNRAEFEGLQNIELIRADLEIPKSTGIEDGTIDIVLLSNILHQANPQKVMAEAVRILKKDGKIIVVDWRKIKIPFGPPKDGRISVDNVKKIAKEEGLKLKEEFDAGAYHFGLIFGK